MTPPDDEPNITQSSGGHGGNDGPPNSFLGESGYGAAASVDKPPTTAVEYEIHDGQTLSEAVVSAVAEAEGCSPLDLHEPLYDWVDPDALDAVFRPTRDDLPTDRLLSFRAYGREVTIVDTRAVHVSEPLDA
ncbi:HalOD1 output domain-containing protein [Haloprofundus halophilus]|uniref:HalOD1 output domain-containing protein n=1 Tax=Haloprofundus halophilus TaxID=2283527 RepID=UPI000E434D8A|nr:HalOD1 output domain-containing protein [Haloprofundus halophilus]